MNSADPKKAIFQIEFKLRYLVNDSMSMTRICTIFDCCRVPLEGLTGLINGRGAGAPDDDDVIDSDREEPCKYFQICACGPGGIAEADGGFAEKLLGVCEKFASREPTGFMQWPIDLVSHNWSPGTISLIGGENYLVPFSDSAGAQSGASSQS